ncbi:glycosyltransferase family 2 protein [Sphingobacterium sp. LRF_L2]|uniref:glycosyltransferase family 2 protein n=1 Tax=Sphingobacterium sp. LRF_L2 TaxID=3369421 RepID=UPI003F627B6E
MSVVTSLNVFLILMTLLYVAVVLYMRRGWSQISLFANLKTELKTTVSILIAARNEEDNIRRTLDCIISQDFPAELLEVIVVDDHSTDRTADIVRTYADRGVKLIQLNEGDQLNSYKKLAITKAISIAKGEIIVTTDADCRMGNMWLRHVVSCFEETGAFLVSSPVAYSEEKSYFERMQSLEFLYLIGLGAAGIGNKNPTTCNGANLAYRKDIFYEMKGFTGIDNLASGDDELFLHKVAERYADKIMFCKAKDAIVYTDAKPTLASFISQRKRWASKSTKYKDRRVVWLGVSIWLFNLALLAGFLVFLLDLPEVHWFFLVALTIKILAEYLFIYPLCSFVGRPSLSWNLPMLSITHVIYLVYIGVMGNVGKYDWKGRKVK